MKISASKYNDIPLQNLEMSGWIKKQLEIQVNGLSGNLDLFWPDVKDSMWFGKDREGWERAPYWLDGALVLAYLLKDEKLCYRVDTYLDYIIEHQHSSGWLGPKEMNVENVEMIFKDDGNYDIWAQFLILKVLVKYHQIKKEDYILMAIKKGLESIQGTIDYTPLFNWGAFRWFEALIPIYYYYEQTQEEWVSSLAVKLRAQGFSYDEYYQYWPNTMPTPKKAWNYNSHVVNNTMAIKSMALWYRISHKKEDLVKLRMMDEKLHYYHGNVAGGINGDECLAGTSAIRGSELCSSVELMYSYEQIIKNTGLLDFANKLEEVTFNTLPATISENMYSHQYLSQANQIECSIQHEWPWNTNDNDANIYGLEPHFGCCTANMHQGWPKFVESSWLYEGNDLLMISLIPIKITHPIFNDVIIETIGNYPFEDSVCIKINNPNNREFKINLRNYTTNDTKMYVNASLVRDVAMTTHHITSDDVINITLEHVVVFVPRNNHYLSIKRGSLTYALNIKADIKQINIDEVGKELPHGDFELYPLSSYNYALSKQDVTIKFHQVSKIPFSSEFPPITIYIKANVIEQLNNEAGCIQQYSEDIIISDEIEEIVLQPFGCTKLRVSEFIRVRQG